MDVWGAYLFGCLTVAAAWWMVAGVFPRSSAALIIAESRAENNYRKWMEASEVIGNQNTQIMGLQGDLQSCYRSDKSLRDEIDYRNVRIGDLQQNVSGLEAEIHKKTEIITQWLVVVRERDVVIGSLEKSLVGVNAELAEARSLIDVRNEEINRLKMHIEDIRFVMINVPVQEVSA